MPLYLAMAERFDEQRLAALQQRCEERLEDMRRQLQEHVDERFAADCEALQQFLVRSSAVRASEACSAVGWASDCDSGLPWCGAED